MNNNKIKPKKIILNQILGIFGIIYLIVTFVVQYALQVILEWFNIEPLFKDIHPLLIIVVVTCFVLIFSLLLILFINSDKKKRSNLLTELQGLAANLNVKIDNCPQSRENIIIKSHKLGEGEFYNYLDEAKERIPNVDGKEIRLTNFARNLTENDLGQNSDNYFNNELQFYKDKFYVHVYKIISIHSKDKFRKCKKLTDKITDLPNFHFAYLKIENFENEKLPKIIGVQIINDEVILMDPTVPLIAARNNFKNPIYIKSQEIAMIYSEYHRKLWNEIESFHNGQNGGRNNKYSGYILYSLEHGKAGNDIWKNINREMLPEERLSTDELRKIGIT